MVLTGIDRLFTVFVYFAFIYFFSIAFGKNFFNFDQRNLPKAKKIRVVKVVSSHLANLCFLAPPRQRVKSTRGHGRL